MKRRRVPASIEVMPLLP
jgi:hypothetical protein